MGRKRFKDQILRQILEACAGGGANKTQIVYSCNLNLHTVVPYMDMLIKNGLVDRAEGEHYPIQDDAQRGSGAGAHARAGEDDA